MPRRPALAAFVVLAAVTLTACGGSIDASQPSSTSPVTAPPSAHAASAVPEGLTAEQLERAVLDASEAPAGLTIDPAAEADTADDPDDPTGCAPVDALSDDEGPTAAVFYSDGVGFKYVSVTLETVSDIVNEFAKGKAAVVACPHLEARGDSGPIVSDATIIGMPSAADESYGVRVTGTYDEVPFTRMAAYARVGSTYIDVYVTRFLGQPSEELTALTQQTLDRAVAKLKANS